MDMRQTTLSLRDRSAAIGLTAALHVLILILLLWLTPDMIPFREAEMGLSAFNLPAEKKGERPRSNNRRKQARRQETAARATPPVPPEKPAVPPPKVQIPGMIQLTPEEFAASDIGRMKGRQGKGDARGGDDAPVYGPGEGPGGAQLFNAQWYREPTDVELAGYLPADMPRNGYGLIACRTIEDFHVDHCRVLGESPLGSGLGRAVRRAAWQFRVIPPRIDGRPQLGAWVRIRIDYVEGARRLN